MALKVFIDFDCNLIAGQTAAPTNWVEVAKPLGVYLTDGILAQDPNVPGYASYSVNHIQHGRHTSSSAWGPLHFATANYFGKLMIGINRPTHSIGDEVWITADIKIGANLLYKPDTTTPSPEANLLVFRWGDLSVVPKSITWSGTTSFTAVFSITNDGVEVATVTVPGIAPIAVPGGATWYGEPLDLSSEWLYMTIHAKLHGSSGLIDVNIGGYAQSVSYTGQNTVQTIAESSTGTLYTADHIHVGHPSFFYPDFYPFGSNRDFLLTGAIDNIGVFDTGFPSGRPNAFRSGTGSSETNSGWSAVGTSPSTIRNALSLPTDAKAARGNEEGASVILSLDGSLSGDGYDSDLLGVNIFLKKVAKRETIDIRIAAGLSNSGVHTMGTQASSIELPLDTPAVPPNVIFRKAGIWEGIYESGLTWSNLSTTGARLVVEVVP